MVRLGHVDRRVVDRRPLDDADEQAVRVDDGGAQEALLAEDLSQGLERIVDPEDHRVPHHQVGEPRVRAREQQRPQRDDALEPSAQVDGVEVLDRIARVGVGLPPDLVDRRRDRLIAPERDVFGPHQPAGRIGVVGEERAHLAGRVDLGGREDRLAIVLEDLAQDVGPVVALELLEDLRRGPRLDLLDRGRRLREGQDLDQAGRGLGAEDVEEPAEVLRGEAARRVGPIALRQRLEERADARVVALGEQFGELGLSELGHRRDRPQDMSAVGAALEYQIGRGLSRLEGRPFAGHRSEGRRPFRPLSRPSACPSSPAARSAPCMPWPMPDPCPP